jgi:hypothetical protein
MVKKLRSRRSTGKPVGRPKGSGRLRPVSSREGKIVAISLTPTVFSALEEASRESGKSWNTIGLEAITLELVHTYHKSIFENEAEKFVRNMHLFDWTKELGINALQKETK